MAISLKSPYPSLSFGLSVRSGSGSGGASCLVLICNAARLRVDIQNLL
jgi:hypothetical protein